MSHSFFNRIQTQETSPDGEAVAPPEPRLTEGASVVGAMGPGAQPVPTRHRCITPEEKARMVMVFRCPTRATVSTFLAQFPSLEQVHLLSRNGDFHRSVGLLFKSKAEAEAAANFGSAEIEGETVRLNMWGDYGIIEDMNQRHRQDLANRVHVHDLPRTVTEEDVWTAFPTAIDVRMHTTKKGEFRGRATVNFPTAQAAQAFVGIEVEVQGALVTPLASLQDAPPVTAPPLHSHSRINDLRLILHAPARTAIAYDCPQYTTRAQVKAAFPRAMNPKIMQGIPRLGEGALVVLRFPTRTEALVAAQRSGVTFGGQPVSLMLADDIRHGLGSTSVRSPESHGRAVSGPSRFFHRRDLETDPTPCSVRPVATPSADHRDLRDRVSDGPPPSRRRPPRGGSRSPPPKRRPTDRQYGNNRHSTGLARRSRTPDLESTLWSDDPQPPPPYRRSPSPSPRPPPREALRAESPVDSLDAYSLAGSSTATNLSTGADPLAPPSPSGPSAFPPFEDRYGSDASFSGNDQNPFTEETQWLPDVNIANSRLTDTGAAPSSPSILANPASSLGSHSLFEAEAGMFSYTRADLDSYYDATPATDDAFAAHPEVPPHPLGFPPVALSTPVPCVRRFCGECGHPVAVAHARFCQECGQSLAV